ncbi:MAG: hypothetical protein ABIO70_21680 [Pseudomonadota bacterium]
MSSARSETLRWVALLSVIAGPGCALRLAPITPYPITLADLQEAPAPAPVALDAACAPPTLDSIAPDPVMLTFSGGVPQSYANLSQSVPAELADGFRQAAGGSPGGVPVAVYIERLYYTCIPRGMRGVRGERLFVEASVLVGDGAPRRTRFTLGHPDCDAGVGEAMVEGGRALAGEVARIANEVTR